ncbi:prolyl oligopeptidase family serine peptidase [Oxalobacteraceae bacterium OTU3CINTB1]|nr:prolyl oligopeptidase family serine peptidase [Oxalobacteraceae bacterium OTU3CINTB1]
MTVADRLPTINALISAGVAALCLTGGLSAAQAREAQQAEHQIDVPGASPFVVYRPETVKAGAPAPLVFLLHGSSGEGASILRRSNLKTLADKHGFIIAAPTGAIRLAQGFAWNIPGVVTAGGAAPGAGDRDDVKYLLSILDLLAEQGLVDRSRVYATGFSGGGRMASWLGCVASTRFAAIAPVVGLRAGAPLASDPRQPDPDSCRPESAVPVVTFAGDSDTTNPIAGGGAKYWQYSMHAAEMRWAGLNRCERRPVTRRISANVYQELYDGCQDGAMVTAYITEGGGHTWLADEEAMWKFFSRYARAADGKLLTGDSPDASAASRQ